ncbi:hypothetical protein EYF80_059882 [Liparis tanakae]|uniref:Uncharacterized protein n=1 Tax=Liparis tanakae TaxID=230148 RepID=A0A4Z2EM45_9TELE|nr:hypothetical protein EYF80_059882 [Liparis tanakae]
MPQTVRPHGLMPQTVRPHGLMPQTVRPHGLMPQDTWQLPPLEETEGQWLAWEAKGRDRLSFINGKASSLFAPLTMVGGRRAEANQ